MTDSDEGQPSAVLDAKTFGILVRGRRKARGWTQENLASEAYSNEDRKSYISRIENGRIPNITRNTVKTIALILKIDPEEIPAALRWPDATAMVKQTNPAVNEMQVEKLVANGQDRAREFGIKEGMLIALARRYAEGSPGDFESALAGLERALEVARDEREKGQLPSNISSAVDTVIARIDAPNDAGDVDAGQAALDDELAGLDAKEARLQAGRARLYQKGVAQAILTRSVENARRFALAAFDLDTPGD